MAIKPKRKPGPRLSIIPAGAVTDPNISAQALRVLALLGRHTDNHGWCCRSQVKMAAELSVGRGTIQRGLDDLVAAGWVEKALNGRGKIDAPEEGEQPFAAHSYRVILDQEMESEGVPADGQGGAHSDGQGVPTQAGRGCPDARAPLTERPLKNDHLLTAAPAPAPVDSLARAPAIWQEIRKALGPDRFAKHCEGGIPCVKDGALVITFRWKAGAMAADEVAGELSSIVGMPVIVQSRAA